MRTNYFILLAFLQVFFLGCKGESIEYVYYPSGNLKMSIPVDSESRKHGVVREFYDGGNIKKSSIYSKGEQHGRLVEFYKDSTVKVYGTGHMGKYTGTQKKYHSNGKLKEYNLFGLNGENQFSLSFDSLGDLRDIRGCCPFLAIGNNDEFKIGETLQLDFIAPVDIPGLISKVEYLIIRGRTDTIVDNHYLVMPKDTVTRSHIFQRSGNYHLNALFYQFALGDGKKVFLDSSKVDFDFKVLE